MTAGVGFNGTKVAISVGGGIVPGTTSKAVTCTNEMGDTSDDQSSGWSEFMAEPLKKTVELAVSGKLKNLGLANSFFNDASNIYPITVTYEDGSVMSFDGAMTGGISLDHPYDEVSTFETTFTSSGAVTFTPGT